jgi:hypothetical protein
VAAKVNDGTMTSFPEGNSKALGISMGLSLHDESTTLCCAPVCRHFPVQGLGQWDRP